MTTHTIHIREHGPLFDQWHLSSVPGGQWDGGNGNGFGVMLRWSTLSPKRICHAGTSIFIVSHTSVCRHCHQSFDLIHLTICIAVSELYILLNVCKPQGSFGVDMSDTTASAPTPKEDAAAKQSEQMSTGSQTVDNHLKAGSHASQAQVRLTAVHAGAALHAGALRVCGHRTYRKVMICT